MAGPYFLEPNDKKKKKKIRVTSLETQTSHNSFHEGSYLPYVTQGGRGRGRG